MPKPLRKLPRTVVLITPTKIQQMDWLHFEILSPSGFMTGWSAVLEMADIGWLPVRHKSELRLIAPLVDGQTASA